MSSFIRPEAKSALWRWREVIAGTALGMLGLTWALGPGGLLGYLGIAMALGGLALLAIGVQRGLFRGRSGGVGSVDVDEGQVTYFGPLTGGAVALRDLTELALIRSRQTPHWRLTAPEVEVFIPVNADGSDALFDAFTALPDLKVQRMLAALSDQSEQDIVIWRRSAVRDATDWLH